MLEEKKQYEVYLSKRLTREARLFHFCADLYQRLFAYAKTLHPPQTPSQEMLAYHALFAHTNFHPFTVQQLHGSVGQAPPLFLKNLSSRSYYYFDVIFTAITNALFQYNGVGLTRMENMTGIRLEQLARLEAKRTLRIPASGTPPRVETLDMPQEELLARFSSQKGVTDNASGEHTYHLGQSLYRSELESLGAPCLTGISSNAYTIFKFLAMALRLSQMELIQLRVCLVAYMVGAHDHTVVEVLDAINYALEENDFRQHCTALGIDSGALVIPLESDTDYPRAMEAIFNELLHHDATATQIQLNITLLMNNTPLASPFPKWIRDIVVQRVHAHTAGRGVSTVNFNALRERVQMDLYTLLQQIQALDPRLLREIFQEDTTAGGLTHLEGIVDLYCAARLSQQPFKLLGMDGFLNEQVSQMSVEDARAAKRLMQCFGFSATRHGDAFLPDFMAQHSQTPVVGFYSIPPKTLATGDGAILCSKGQTPLLDFCWLLACIHGRQDFHLVRAITPDLLTSGNQQPSRLAYQLQILASCGYQLVYQANVGFTLSPPAHMITTDVAMLCNALHTLNTQTDLSSHFAALMVPATQTSITELSQRLAI